jgi:phosphoribosylanthranilate isomerase
MLDIQVKICGLTTPEAAVDVAEAGASYIGLVLFPPSPRFVDAERARQIADAVPPCVTRVALVVDPDDALVDEAVGAGVDMLQLHGTEAPERVADLKNRTGLPVMKAIGIRDADDLAQIDRYVGVSDQLLIDTKPPKGATRPGGNAVPFDWTLIAGREWPLPWMLAGGLTIENVAEAIRVSGANQLDLSSAVESAPGVKDPDLVRAFMRAVRLATPSTFSALT